MAVTCQPRVMPIELREVRWPDHTQLPETDGKFVQNFQEHPQSRLLTEAIEPLLKQRHPDGNFIIGQDSGIYWNPRLAVSQDPVRGAVAPDWFYISGVPPLLEGVVRRSYVLWEEYIPPLIAIEFVSGDGSEERDQTPKRGKFWVYEKAIHIPYYAIYEVEKASVEVYYLIEGEYHLMLPNTHGHLVIAPLDVALGIWQGNYQGMELPWLRWYDLDGNLVPNADELIAQERQERERERQQAEQRLELERQQAEQRLELERQEKEQALLQAEKLAAKLRAMGVDLSTLDLA